MKPIILKKMIPIAVFVLGILGAVTTTSMQSTAKVDTNLTGYASIPNNPCSVPVICSDDGGEYCHVEDIPTNPQAFRKDGLTTCPDPLYRPN